MSTNLNLKVTVWASEEETALAAKATAAALSPAEARRRMALFRRMRDDAIAEDDYAELLRLNEQAEELLVTRLECAEELARLREVPLLDVLTQLGFRRRTVTI